MAERLIELKNIRKTFDGEVALGKIDLYVRRREFLTLLGPSGCGKTTMLRIIAGFEQADSGDLLFEGKRINDVHAAGPKDQGAPYDVRAYPGRAGGPR